MLRFWFDKCQESCHPYNPLSLNTQKAKQKTRWRKPHAPTHTHEKGKRIQWVWVVIFWWLSAKFNKNNKGDRESPASFYTLNAPFLCDDFPQLFCGGSAKKGSFVAVAATTERETTNEKRGRRVFRFSAKINPRRERRPPTSIHSLPLEQQVHTRKWKYHFNCFPAAEIKGEIAKKEWSFGWKKQSYLWLFLWRGWEIRKI